MAGLGTHHPKRFGRRRSTHHGVACVQAFVYNPEQLVGAARTTAVRAFGSAGTSSSRMAKQFPALSGYGIAQVQGCSVFGVL